MGFVVVVFSEAFHVVESWIVEFECLPESFDLALRGGFSNGTVDVLYAMRFEVCGESALAVVAVVLGSVVTEHLVGCSSVA